MNYTYFLPTAYILKANYSGEGTDKFTLYFGAEENIWKSKRRG